MESTTKKNNRYKFSLEALSAASDKQASLKKLELEIVNHDDIFRIIEVIKSKNLLTGESDATEFAIGLKLFSEVILRNKELALFEDLKLAIGEFMKKLKAS